MPVLVAKGGRGSLRVRTVEIAGPGCVRSLKCFRLATRSRRRRRRDVFFFSAATMPPTRRRCEQLTAAHMQYVPCELTSSQSARHQTRDEASATAGAGRVSSWPRPLRAVSRPLVVLDA